MIIKSSFSKVKSYTNHRVGETKLGEVISLLDSNISSLEALEDYLKLSIARFIIIGISEDIGVRANYGQKGTRNAYDSFIRYFVNIQNNQFLDVTSVCILGDVFIDDLLEKSDNNEDIKYLRELTHEVDIRVHVVINKIAKLGKIPIVIGGGHNNSYGIVKGISTGLNQEINVLNIDPHADLRMEEGRHSGNGFRYAYSQGFISKYAVLGLHEIYNNQAILDMFESDKNFLFETFESGIKLQVHSLTRILNFLDKKIGLEIDLDGIKNMPSSAISPIGYSEEEVLKFIAEISQKKEVLYYHLAEGSPDEKYPYKVGKFLCYAVSTILKSI